MMPRVSKSELFWSKVDKKGVDECWLWTAYKGRLGYGKVMFMGKVRPAHRVAYAMHHGIDLPDPSTKVLHSCDVRACCNPSHLSLGTQADNVADMIAKGRRGQPVLPRGEKHPLAKLRDEDVIRIRCLAAAGGHKQCELARMFGVSNMTVSLIVNRKIWTHLPEVVS